MDIRIGDVLEMKKSHPCGCKKFLVTKSGMDFKLRCLKCGHEFLILRSKAEKRIKNITRQEDNDEQ